MFVVVHKTHGNDVLTAHSTIQHARSSIKMRMRSRQTLAGSIYEVHLDDLTPIEQHGTLDSQVPGQQPLF